MKKLVLSLLGSAVVMGAQAQLINGAGSSFRLSGLSPNGLRLTRAVDPAVHVNYQSVGSGAAQQLLLKETVDFGASEAPMSEDNLAKGPGKILHIPVLVGGVAITYNLAGSAEIEIG